MANYPGNASLSPAVKERVVMTFQQTLALYKQGRHDEVIQGCGLILRMDPMFDPAKRLLEKTRNPSAPVDVDALGAAAAPPPPSRDPLDDARQAMGARDFQRVVDITTAVLTSDLLNEDARVLNEQAREKMEAAPFVEQFGRKFDQQFAAKNMAAARAELEKARALDPDHPLVSRMEQQLAAASPPPAPPQPAAPAAPKPFAFDSTPSFVVDAPPPSPASPRAAAQASDFGFTFEEEKPAEQPKSPIGGFSFDEAPKAPAAPATPPSEEPAGFSFSGFSFDTPSAPKGDALSNFQPQQQPPPPVPDDSAPHMFDFSAASVEASSDDQKKIAGYLADGDRASDAGDYQKAIDIWSRIFLIDVTNEEASQRIDNAKLRRREVEQKIEAVLAAGIAAFEKDDQKTAREKLNEVLQADPGNETAQDYLDRLSEIPVEGGAAARAVPFIPPTPSAPPKGDLFEEESFTTPLIPPEPATAGAIPQKKKVTAPVPVVARKKSSTMTVAIVAAVVVLLAAGGWFAWSKHMNRPTYDPAATQVTLRTADALAKKGKYDQAIAMLQDIKPDDPQHDKALVMIADFQKRKSQTVEMIDGRPAPLVYADSLAAGKAAFEAHDYDAAKNAFDKASRIKPLPPDIAPLYDQATQQVQKLDAAKSLFKEAKYADAIANLQPLLASDPQNRSIQRLIRDAHFNLGAQALQDERTDRTADAIREFDEVLKSNPDDELARRSRALAERYNGQPKDLLYKMYVKYLPLRKVS